MTHSKSQIQIHMGERTQMLPHAENFTADHHPHVAVPLETEIEQCNATCCLVIEWRYKEHII